MFLTTISFLITWFVSPVRSEPCKHYCWTRLLALFQTKYAKLLLFQHVCCSNSNGFVHHLGSDLILLLICFLTLLVLHKVLVYIFFPFLLCLECDIIFAIQVFNTLTLVTL